MDTGQLLLLVQPLFVIELLLCEDDLTKGVGDCKSGSGVWVPNGDLDLCLDVRGERGGEARPRAELLGSDGLLLRERKALRGLLCGNASEAAISIMAPLSVSICLRAVCLLSLPSPRESGL